MIYSKSPHPDGEYVDNEGQHWLISCCRSIRTPEGVNIGWTEFPSLEAALEAWGLKAEPFS